jgi:hypothetical protein
MVATLANGAPSDETVAGIQSAAAAGTSVI